MYFACFEILFHQEGIKPMWEDVANRKGGKWIVNVKRDMAVGDLWWQTIVSISLFVMRRLSFFFVLLNCSVL